MKQKKYYTQIEVDEYVRKLMTDSEIALSKQAERLEKEKQINKSLTKELEASKQKEKSTARQLTIAERKAKYIESTTRSKCAMEIERLARLSEKWEDFFAGLSEKYKALRINILNKYLSICEDIEKKHVILVDTGIKFTRQKFDNFASYYYDTKTTKTELIERGSAIG